MEAAWSHERNYEDFKSRLTVFLDKCHYLRYKPAELWDQEGDIRRQELIEHAKNTKGGMPPEVYEETMEILNPISILLKR